MQAIKQKHAYEQAFDSRRNSTVFAKQDNLQNNNQSPVNQGITSSAGFWDKAIHLAEVICSRESVYRTALDVISFELPSLIAAGTRNIYSFIEGLFISTVATSLFAFAPSITRLVGKFVGKQVLPQNLHKAIEHLLLFQVPDLNDDTSFEKAKERIITEETNDNIFLSKIFKNSPKKVESYMNRAKSIKDYLSNLKPSKALLASIKKMKKLTIWGESLLEGSVWGSLFIWVRLIRKYILKQDSFTGTKGYLNNKQSKKLGNDQGYNLVQKIGAALAVISAPLLNAFLLNKTKDPEKVKQSPVLKMIDNQWDMTHGVLVFYSHIFNCLH